MEVMAAAFAVNKVYELTGKEPLEKRCQAFQKFKKNLTKLQSVLTTIEATFKAAHLRRITDPNLLDYLSKLKDAAFDAGDVLDAIYSEVLRREGNPCRVSRFFSRVLSRCGDGYRITRVLERLEDIKSERRLEIGGGGRTAAEEEDQRRTYSFQSSDAAVGRIADRDAVLSLLASEPRVVAVVGIAGSGKTTLSKMVYKAAGETFHKIWVYVGQEMSVKKIAKGILEGLGKKVEFSDLEGITNQLVKDLQGKKLLLVLDDVWNESSEVWAAVEGLLWGAGEPASRVLVTTRNQNVAVVMRAEVHSLGVMSDEDCWTLIKRRAGFSGTLEPPRSLVAIGQEIAKNCNGLPLLANVLGGLLLNNLNKQHWEMVADNRLWDCLREEQEDEKEINPTLRLSYFNLPLRSKPCFSYLAVFGKGCDLERERIVRHWIAHGFINDRGTRPLEFIGEEILKDLVSRGLLDEVAAAEGEEGGIGSSIYRMHDLVHDLASFTAKTECHVLTDSRVETIRHRIRFLSVGVEAPAALAVVRKFRKSRLLLSARDLPLTSRFLEVVFQKLRFLRVVDLSSCKMIEVLPKAVGDLIHLRYMNLSHTGVTNLPGVIGRLLNLIYLDVSHTRVQNLTLGIGKLINLRYLDISHTRVKILPVQIGKLINLSYLDISHTRVQNLPVEIGNLTKLSYLDISHTPVQNLPSQIGKLTKLSYLDISHTRVQNLSNEIRDLVNLGMVRLATTRNTAPATSSVNSPDTAPVTSPDTAPVTSPDTVPATSLVNSPNTAAAALPNTAPATSSVSSRNTIPTTLMMMMMMIIIMIMIIIVMINLMIGT